MNLFLSLVVLFATLTVQAQLAVTVSPTKLIGRKAIVTLGMTNGLAEPVKSASAICFLLDNQGTMIGQSTKWVIGGAKDRPALQPKAGTTFSFVITSPQPFTTTNLSAYISFARLTLSEGKVGDMKHDVVVTTAN